MTFSTDYARCEPTSDRETAGRNVTTAGTHRNRRPPMPRKGKLDKRRLAVRPDTRSDDLLSATGSIRKQSCRNSGCWLHTVYVGPSMWDEKLAFGLIPHPTSFLILWTKREAIESGT